MLSKQNIFESLDPERPAIQQWVVTKYNMAYKKG
jgi:hypothetical protein